MKISLIFFLAATVMMAQGLAPRAGKGEADITTKGFHIVPKNGTFTAALFEERHPSGYIRRPGCWAKELGHKQHVFRIRYDEREITIFDAHPKSVIEWECHGFMKMNPYELCITQARTKAAFIACGPPQGELH